MARRSTKNGRQIIARDKVNLIIGAKLKVKSSPKVNIGSKTEVITRKKEIR